MMVLSPKVAGVFPAPGAGEILTGCCFSLSESTAVHLDTWQEAMDAVSPCQRAIS